MSGTTKTDLWGQDATVEADGTLTLRAPKTAKEGNEATRGYGGGLGTVFTGPPAA